MTDALVLHGRAATLVLELVPGGVPLWRHWGARLADDVVLPGPVDARPRPSFATDRDVPFALFPGYGRGWFGASALLAHREGRDFALDFDGVEGVRDGQAATVVMTDSVAQVEVAVTLALDADSDVLTVATRLTNRGAGALEVQWLAAACLPLPPGARAVRHFSGRHNGEFAEQTDALGRGQWRRENRRGLTSHDCFPGAVVLGEDGVAWGAQLAWSGNHLQLIDWVDDGRWQWQLGEGLAPGELRLAPGESVTSPEVLATYSPEGAGGVARNFHAAVRARSAWPGGAMSPRKVHLNTWEALYFSHDEADLMALADAAAELGIERFVLDDGWFAGRRDDRRALGDWRVDAGKYPRGLAPLAEHVIARGMDFGLWVEPEMVNPDSDLYRAHPDWALALAGRAPLTARHQLVLDLSREAVRDHLFEALAALLGTLPVAYLKWDHNRDLTDAGGVDGRAAYRAQVQGSYALLDRLRAAFPQVEIEACAGGGGRIDAAIAKRTHRFWTSDTTDAVSRVAIQRGYLQFMPPERMGAHIGSATAHTSGRTQSLDFRAAVALPGHLGVELDPRRLDPGERDRLAAWIARYKALRDRLHAGQVWTGDAGDGVLWQAQGTPDALVVFAYRLCPPSWRYPPPLCLPMLDRGARYAVTMDGVRTAVDGSWLADVGLPLPATASEAASIIEIARL